MDGNMISLCSRLGSFSLVSFQGYGRCLILIFFIPPGRFGKGLTKTVGWSLLNPGFWGWKEPMIFRRNGFLIFISIISRREMRGRFSKFFITTRWISFPWWRWPGESTSSIMTLRQPDPEKRSYLFLWEGFSGNMGRGKRPSLALRL